MYKMIYEKFSKDFRKLPMEVKHTDTFISVLLEGWRIYGGQVVFWASLAYVLLYASILFPGLVLNSYLKIEVNG